MQQVGAPSLKQLMPTMVSASTSDNRACFRIGAHGRTGPAPLAEGNEHCLATTGHEPDSNNSALWEECAMPIDEHATSRRRFLQFLAASPLLAGSDLAAMAEPRRRRGCPIR